MSDKLSNEKNKNFSEFPKEIDEYFVNNSIKIEKIPKEFLYTIERKSPLIIATARSFIQLIENEISFWNANDTENKLKDFSHIERLTKSKDYFNNSIRNYSPSSNKDYWMTPLQNSINSVNSGIMYSKSSLTKYLLKLKDNNPNFLRGFRVGIMTNKNSSMQNTIDDYEGLFVALKYRKVIEDFESPISNEIEKFNNAVINANENFSKLDKEYLNSFHQQEERIKQFESKVNLCINEMNEGSNKFFDEKNKRCNDLENLYEEKLKLQAPAVYWERMDEEYTKKGNKWMGWSIVLSIVSIIGLVLLLTLLPNLFSQNSHWIDVLKNSAIITVITSITVYMLRIFMKMAMSSFHLARDAKERNKLTYFYLALIEKKAVTEKERAIILNSLFSRSDTGLLKGESAPSMSANVTDLVQTLSTK